MFSKATELEGKASVNYPGSMSLTHGAANSFLAGENVPLSAQWTLTSGSANINNAKTMGDLELLLRFALDAFVDVEVCFFDCADLAIIPSPDFDTGDTTLFSFDAAQATQQIPGFLQDALFGPVSPMFGPISVSPTTTSVNPSTGRIVAEDTNTFATMAIDIDEVATNLGLAPPLGRSTPNVDDGVELSYDIFDATSDIDFIAHQKLTFDTAVLIQLEFSRPVAGVLGSFVSTTTTPDGKIQTVTYMAGE